MPSGARQVRSVQQRARPSREWCRQLTFPNPDKQERDGPACQASSEDLGSAKEPCGSKDQGGSKDRDGSEDIDTAFARIVASLRAAEPDLPRPTAGEADQDQLPASQPRPTAGNADEDHFEPPEPPPLPIPRPRTVGGVALLTVGVLLLAAPALLGLAERVATPLGLLALTAGIGWLVIGLRSDSPPEGPDDGARL